MQFWFLPERLLSLIQPETVFTFSVLQVCRKPVCWAMLHGLPCLQALTLSTTVTCCHIRSLVTRV